MKGCLKILAVIVLVFGMDIPLIIYFDISVFWLTVIDILLIFSILAFLNRNNTKEDTQDAEMPTKNTSGSLLEFIPFIIAIIALYYAAKLYFM